MNPLPIDAVLPELRAALRSRHEAVLEAPPGAGKTTRVPLALLDEPWPPARRLSDWPRSSANGWAIPSATAFAWSRKSVRAPASRW